MSNIEDLLYSAEEYGRRHEMFKEIDKLKLKALFSIKLSMLNSKIEIFSKTNIFELYLITKLVNQIIIPF